MPINGRQRRHKNKHPAQGISASAICGLALLAAQTGMVGTAHAQAPAQAQTQANRQTYNVPAGPLAPALRSFASAANLPLSFVADQTEGKLTAGLRGQFTPPEALAALLAGSGLQAVRLDNGGYVLRSQPAPADRAPTEPSAQGSTLPAVQVTAPADRETAIGPVLGYAARISATATKTDTPLIEVPQSISVIGREEMDARGAQDVMDVIRYSPGVAIGVNGPDNRGWEDISIRGFPSYYSTYQNGLVQTPFNVTYYLTDPYAFERVEVLRGPSSMIFGQGDAGGIINRVTKLPTGERIREIELQYGNFQRKQLAFDIGDKIANTDLSYRLVGVGLDSNDQDRYPDGQKLNRTRSFLAPSLRWQPNAGTSFTLYGEFLKNSAAEDPYYVNRPGRELTNVKMGDYSYSGIKQEQSSLGYRFESRLNDNWTVRQNLRYSKLELHRRVVWANDAGADPDTVSRIARTWDDPMSQTALDTSVEGKFRTESTEHTVLLGVDWNKQKGKAHQFIGTAPDLNLSFPVYGIAIPTPDQPLNDYTQTTQQIGIYAQDQIKIDNHWIVTLGGRQDHVRQTTDDRLNAAYTQQKDSAFSGRAAVSYLFDNGLAPYLSYAESFLPTAGLDAQSNPFKPSRGKQVELGLKYQPVASKMLLTAALFDLRKSNIVSYNPVTNEGRQIARQRSRGIELEAKGELIPGLNATASYTYLDPKIVNSADPDEIGKRPVAIPKQTAAVWLDYTMGNGVGFGGGVRYQGGIPIDEHNTAFTRGVTLADAAVHYERGPWRFALNVSNLFNKKYIAGCYQASCYRGTERLATLSARYRF